MTYASFRSALTSRLLLAAAAYGGLPVGGRRDAATQIADDEARHAELAWRFVAWAIATGGKATRALVAQAFDRVTPGAPDRAPLPEVTSG